MRRTLGLFALGLSFWFSGCMSTEMPIEPLKEAEREADASQKKKDSKSTVIRVESRCEFSVPFYGERPKTEVEEDKKKIKDIDRLCMLSSTKSYVDAEDQLEPIFEIFDEISGTGPEFDFDIIKDRALDYPFLRLYNWSGIYFSPYLLVKNSKLSLSTLAHEDGHRKDHHYSKWDYAFDWSRRCRMEAVAVSHQHLVADYFCNVYRLGEIAEDIWEDVRLSRGTIVYLKRFQTFEEFYNDEHGYLKEKGLGDKLEYIIGRVIYHIILYKNTGSPVRTFDFLRRHNDREIFQAIYQVLEKKNYVDAVEESIKMAKARMWFGRNIEIDFRRSPPFVIGRNSYLADLMITRPKKKD